MVLAMAFPDTFERDASVARPPTEGHDLTMAFLVREMSSSAGAMISVMPFPVLRCRPYGTSVI